MKFQRLLESTCEKCISPLIISWNYCVGCVPFVCSQHFSFLLPRREEKNPIFIVKLLFYLIVWTGNFISCEISGTCVICVSAKSNVECWDKGAWTKGEEESGGGFETSADFCLMMRGDGVLLNLGGEMRGRFWRCYEDLWLRRILIRLRFWKWQELSRFAVWEKTKKN
jgi:hypothetical protein